MTQTRFDLLISIVISLVGAANEATSRGLGIHTEPLFTAATSALDLAEEIS